MGRKHTQHILLYNSILYSTRFYVVMWHQILYFLQNLLIPLLLFTNKERSSSKRRMEGGIADETFIPPFKCECFGSATPSWVHTGLTASTMNVKCHTKRENRRSLYCSSSSHQKSVSADDKSKHNKPSPSITRTNLLTLALYMSHSGGSFGYRCIAVTAIHAVCVSVLSVLQFSRSHHEQF